MATTAATDHPPGGGWTGVSKQVDTPSNPDASAFIPPAWWYLPDAGISGAAPLRLGVPAGPQRGSPEG